MVAASDAQGALPVWSCYACVAATILGLVASVVVGQRYSIMNVSPFPFSNEVLELKGREMLNGFGYTEKPADRASSWLGGHFLHGLVVTHEVRKDKS